MQMVIIFGLNDVPVLSRFFDVGVHAREYVAIFASAPSYFFFFARVPRGWTDSTRYGASFIRRRQVQSSRKARSYDMEHIRTVNALTARK